jgi:hypothetical protein
MLGHLLQHHAHAEGVEATTAVLLGGAERPQSGRLRLGGEAGPVVLRQSGRVGVERLLERDDLVTDEAADLLADCPYLVGQREAGKRRHGPG